MTVVDRVVVLIVLKRAKLDRQVAVTMCSPLLAVIRPFRHNGCIERWHIVIRQLVSAINRGIKS